jgi:predicted permease
VVWEILQPVLRLFAFTLGGFLVFRIAPIQKHLLRPVVWITTNLVLPFYFIHTLPARWADGAEAGWVWTAIFFGAYFVFLGLQFGLGKLLINRAPLMQTEYPREFLVIFAMHNAGYIPLPIIAALAPPAVTLYLSFYLMAFMFSFFTIGVWIIQGAAGTRPKVPINGPIIGLVVGVIVAATGFYNILPGWATAPLRFSARIGLDLIMVVLGGILASIPSRGLRYRREFGGYILYKMLLFPAAVVGVLLLVPLRAMDPELVSGIKLAVVLEAVVPPATNIMVITRAYGTDEQVEYAGGAIIVSYIAAVVIIPVFLVISRLLFG